MIRFAGFSLIATAVVVFGGAVITGATGGSVTKGVVAYCGGVNLAAGWLAFVPVVLVRRRRKDYVPQALLAATTIRLFLVAGATLAAMWSDWYDWWTLSVWMIAFYIAMLVVETGFAVRFVKESHAVGQGG